MSVSLTSLPAPEPVALEPMPDPDGPDGLAVATYQPDGSPALRLAVCLSGGRAVLAVERTVKGKPDAKGKATPDVNRWKSSPALADFAAAVAAGLVTVD